jgi:hypothetical protein
MSREPSKFGAKNGETRFLKMFGDVSETITREEEKTT